MRQKFKKVIHVLKTFSVPLLLAGTLVSLSASAADSDAVADTTFELGIGVYVDSEGVQNDALRSNGGLLLQGSYRFAPAWSVTGSYTYAHDIEISGYGSKTGIHRFIADVNYDFTPKSFYSPYLFAGAGYEHFSDTPSDRDGVLLGFGAGLRLNFSDTIGVNASAMLKTNMEHADRAVLWNAAVNYRF